MADYNWEKIAEGYSDNELKRFYREKDREPAVKIKAVISEMVKRGLLSQDMNFVPKRAFEDYVVDLSEISHTKPNFKLAKYSIAMIAVILFIDMLKIVSSALQYRLLDSANEGAIITDKIASSNDLRELLVTLLYVFSSLFSAVIFIIWFNRAYENLHRRFLKCEFDSGWAIGSWFVPIISLFRPYNIMNELVKITNLVLKRRGIGYENKSAYVGLWWSFWVVTQFAAMFLRKFYDFFDADKIETGMLYTIFSIGLSGLNIVLGVITILMIKRYSEKEELLYRSEINAHS